MNRKSVAPLRGLGGRTDQRKGKRIAARSGRALKMPLLALLVFWIAACQDRQAESATAEEFELTDQELREKAERLAHELILVDTHIDIPYRLSEGWEDISRRTPGGDFDFPRARAGGLNAPFMAIYIPTSFQEAGGAREMADQLIDMIEDFETRWPDQCAVARSPDEIRQNAEKGLISLPMGMENGAGIEDDLSLLRHLYDRGIRYITLAHSRSNLISDSSYDTERRWNGLSPFGREAVAEMNRLGMMVDVSHISDEAFYQVLETTEAPAIASHSSCRAFTPGWERNMSDEMIQALARNGGAVCINFGSSFLRDDYRQNSQVVQNKFAQFLNESGLAEDSPQAREHLERLREEHPPAFADVADAAAHIDHVVKLVGIDHVCLGSDFDGVGDSLPYGLKDVSEYPNLFYELLKLDYSENEIEKIASTNVFRVWEEVERVSARLRMSVE
ncbi:MAG TPA: dipeptidase [Acidobacteriota bacterium]|nr:dipeptidase [Acidobacteriota bacterium]